MGNMADRGRAAYHHRDRLTRCLVFRYYQRPLDPRQIACAQCGPAGKTCRHSHHLPEAPPPLKPPPPPEPPPPKPPPKLPLPKPPPRLPPNPPPIQGPTPRPPLVSRRKKRMRKISPM